jgi:hypothetical protein
MGGPEAEDKKKKKPSSGKEDGAKKEKGEKKDKKERPDGSSSKIKAADGAASKRSSKDDSSAKRPSSGKPASGAKSERQPPAPVPRRPPPKAAPAPGDSYLAGMDLPSSSESEEEYEKVEREEKGPLMVQVRAVGRPDSWRMIPIAWASMQRGRIGAQSHRPTQPGWTTPPPRGRPRHARLLQATDREQKKLADKERQQMEQAFRWAGGRVVLRVPSSGAATRAAARAPARSG